MVFICLFLLSFIGRTLENINWKYSIELYLCVNKNDLLACYSIGENSTILKVVNWPIVFDFCVILVFCGELSHWQSSGISMACLTMAPRHRSNVLRHRQMTRAIVKLSCAIVKLSSANVQNFIVFCSPTPFFYQL